MAYPNSYTQVSSLMAFAPLVSGFTSLNSAHLSRYIYEAESLINAKLSTQYSVPIGSPLMESLTTDVALYNIYSKNVVSETFNKTQWPGVFKDAMDMINDIADGKVTLVDSGGNAIASAGRATPWSNTKGYKPTMDVDDWEASRVSSVRVDDVTNNRQ